MSKTWYPIMLDLEGKPCLIVGGGRVAERKARTLMKAGASVTVVSPQVTPQLEAWKAEGLIQTQHEVYTIGLAVLAEAWLVFAATGDAMVNAQVCAEAEALGKLVNSADDAETGGFIVPATLRRGRLTLAISTAGASPALAAKVRRQLEDVFGEEYEHYLELLHELRLTVQAIVPDTSERQELFRAMLGWELLPLLKSNSVSTVQLRSELLKRVEADPTTEGIHLIGSWLRHLQDSLNGN
ncbi:MULTISPECIES: bifunctional precorrin-2 dehydrogenase/sirohydrochlorin ferrochelatase [unclassified Paenibacillus]|uniref:precorrin-2 dehydrogenase/sirohydrochlorin ferrochelatase family protein n=1 Tax=unclassified Paenibacillus TaxID=185978 RepID=UPI001AEAD3E7|nr:MULTISPECIES: bifunctional precorrin-2 dehydrogenase/sirohydrochlorin ferrochelatase [unclassified Paenibacillus]MBP1156611.1 precorrin-2 dehydrogenase/sirohydrochlorin ferrochelatase [Paenibacillus sp. PvP091]MBP1172651.1 precorrin-2 dehydrogenase/sirohydrochlorin ferrochelatase [Paenibacillus sp. PvR098]MBP2439031.1 precorrin-2 dehydrogenase/sirohydrochlorin ferrochelatase [Paenibacillus sp. PvP052]